MDKEILEEYVRTIMTAKRRGSRCRRRKRGLPDHLHIWLAGCVRASSIRKSPFAGSKIPTSVDMPNYSGVTGSINTGCMQVIYFTREDRFEYRPDAGDAVKYALCALDPSEDIPQECSPQISPKKTRFGARLTINELADQYRQRPNDGHKFCTEPLKIKCFDPQGNEVTNGITCSIRKGFSCRGENCKDYKISVCCPKSENNCQLFPKVCESTQKCKPLYYAHECKCAQGYSKDRNGDCVDLASQCRCGCTGDPHCRMCNNYFFDFMGVCRYTAITNHCHNKVQIYPSVEVITKHKPCGRPGSKVTCTHNLEVRICETRQKKDAGDCIISKMGYWDGKVACGTTYPKKEDGKRWMVNKVKTFLSSKNLCNFVGFGLSIQIQGSKWNSVIDKKFKDHMCGLCGAWNDQNSGLVSRDGELFQFDTTLKTKKVGLDRKTVQVQQITRQDATQFGDSWLYNVEDAAECREPTPVGEDCTDAQINEAKAKCSFLEIVAKKFNENDYMTAFDECVEDECKGTPNAVCIAIEEYVERKVLELGLQENIPQWRSDPASPCKLDCGDNEQDSTGKIRQLYCDGTEGDVLPCVCENGFKFDTTNSKCVAESDCKCLMRSTGDVVVPGVSVYDPSDCTQKFSCRKGVLIPDDGDSGLDPNAVCNTMGPTGCKPGFEGDGYTCKISSTSCETGWMKTDDRCIKLKPLPVDFRVAAETCRKVNADLVSVANDTDLDNIKKIIIQSGETGQKYYIAGVCGSTRRPNTESLQDNSLPGSDSYIRPSAYASCTPGDEPVCYVAELKDGEVKMSESDCVNKHHFICEKKPEDEFEDTEECTSDALSNGEDLELYPNNMRDRGCETCDKPRDIKCLDPEGKSTQDVEDGSVCNIEDFFVSSKCTEEKCGPFKVTLHCQIFIDECEKGIDFCDDDNEVCVDKTYGYDCQCKEPMSGRVIRDNKEECTRQEVCKMSRSGPSADLQLVQFGQTDVIDFNRKCSFKLISTKDCGDIDGNGSPLEVIYTRGACPALIFKSPSGDLKITATGSVVPSSQTHFTIDTIGDDKWSVKSADDHIECIVKVDGGSFTKINCYASDLFNPSCGVCTHIASNPLTTSAEIYELFDSNKVGRYSCKPPGGGSTGGSTIPSATTSAPTCETPMCDAIIGEAFGAACSGAADFFSNCQAELCSGEPICDYIQTMVTKLEDKFNADRSDTSVCEGGLDAVKAAVLNMATATGCNVALKEPEEESTCSGCEHIINAFRPAPECTSTVDDMEKLTAQCAIVVCEIRRKDTCSFIASLMDYAEKAFTDNPTMQMLGCYSQQDIRDIFKKMSENTGCVKVCTKENTELSWNVPTTQATCQNDVSTTDAGREVNFAPDCVCKNGFMLSGIGGPTGMPCIDAQDCGCWVNNNPIPQGTYGQVNPETCEKSMLCKGRNDIDPALKACDENAACVNGECKCNDNFAGDGYSCNPVEVTNPTTYCFEKMNDESEKSEKVCMCRMGFASVCSDCIDIDECDIGEADCGDNTVCLNTQGSYQCQCKPGYKRGPDGKSCEDIKECLNSPCDENSRCFEQEGSFACICCAGYSPTSKTTCKLTKPDKVPDKCCVCSDIERCYNPNNPNPDQVCYTDTDNVETQYDSYYTAYIDKCLKNKSLNIKNVKNGQCSTPVTVVTRATTQALPITTTVADLTVATTTNPASSNPCGDIVCDFTSDPTDKASGAVCQLINKQTYDNRCAAKKAACRGNGNSPPSEYPPTSEGACPTVTVPPTTKKPTEFTFGSWSTWSTCSAIECGLDKGVQTRERDYTDNQGAGNQPKTTDIMQTRSCEKQGCPQPTQPPSTTSAPGAVTTEAPEDCSRIMCDGDENPVCVSIGGGKYYVYPTLCHVRRLVCNAKPATYFSEDKDKCADTINSEGPSPCSNGPVEKDVRPAVRTKNGVKCFFTGQKMPWCENSYCTLENKETPSSLCCKGATFTGESVTFQGACDDGSFDTYEEAIPETCRCENEGDK